MTLSETVKETFGSFLAQLGLAWWVEIVTNKPQCTYYFGPFASFKEAELALPGYTEDLEDEEALGITVALKRCQPKDLTIFEDELGENLDSQILPVTAREAQVRNR